MHDMSYISREHWSKSTRHCQTSAPRNQKSKTQLNGTRSARCYRSSRKMRSTRAKQDSPLPFPSLSNVFLNIPFCARTSSSTPTPAPSNMKAPCRWSLRSRTSFEASRMRRSKRRNVIRLETSSRASRDLTKFASWRYLNPLAFSSTSDYAPLARAH